MFMIAPQPGNQLNGDRLHRQLARFPMPDRDEYFGFPTYHELSDDTSAGAVLARWASKGPYPSYDPEVIELAAIPLMWLLLSPNRFMRDWVTKALVELLRGHIAVVERLVVRFWSIDDPYVVQRVLVIAYGALMRCDASQRDDAKRLVAHVCKLVFTRPVRADELMLDAARGIVEWGIANGLTPRSQLKSTRRPYGLKPPGPVPSEEKLEEKYGWQEGSDDERHSSVLHSLLSGGDFGRYVVQPGMDMFSRYPLDKPYPEPEEQLDDGSTIVRSGWKKFVKSLTPDQRARLESLSQTESRGVPDRLKVIRSGLEPSLSPEQSELFRGSIRRPARRAYREDSYPAGRAMRWAFVQVLRLGLTPERFEDGDRRLGGDGSSQDGHKVERWGKKYQWMAFHELLARVADNFHTARRYADHQEYQGLHQLTAAREIDPSLAPVPFNQLFEPESGNDTWPPSAVDFPTWPPVPIDFQQIGGSLARFISDLGSEPALDRVVVVNDSTGEHWVLLYASIAQGDLVSDTPWRHGLQQSFSLNSWFIPASLSGRALRHLPGMIRTDNHDLVDSHGHVDCCYFGEIGWSPHGCSNRHADLVDVGVGGNIFQMANTVENYLWEGNVYDCSIGKSVSAPLPSTFIRSRSSLTVDEHGPSWFDNGEVVLTNHISPGSDRQRGLLVRASWLSGFMKAHKVDLLSAASTLRWRVAGDNDLSPHGYEPERHDRLDVYAAVRVDSNLGLVRAPVLRFMNRRET